MQIELEFEQEDDGRWIAEAPAWPGVMAYGAGRDDAARRVKALALRVIADKNVSQDCETHRFKAR